MTSYVTNMNTKVNTDYTDIGSIFCDNSYNQTLGGNKTFTGTVYVPTPAMDASRTEVVTAKWTNDTIADQFIKNGIFKYWSFINVSKMSPSGGAMFYTLSENGVDVRFDPGMYLVMVKQNKGNGNADFLQNYALAFVAITNEIDGNSGPFVNYIFHGGSSLNTYNIFTNSSTAATPVYTILITSLNTNPIDVKVYQLIM